MAKRDVELVIRARDQASKAVDGVADALRSLRSQQDGVSASAGKMDGLLGALGAEFQKLGQEAQALRALGQVAGQIDKAAAAVSRLEREFQDSTDGVARLQQELQQTGVEMTRLRVAADQAKTALGEQRSTLTALNREQRTLDSQVTALAAGYKELRSEAVRAKRPSDELRLALQQQGIALQNALAAQLRGAEAIRAQNAAVASSKAAYDSARVSLDRTSASQDRLARASQEAASALLEQEAALSASREEFKTIKTTADQAAAALGNVALNQQELAAASQQAAADLKRVDAELKKQASRSATASASSAGSGRVSTPETKAYLEQVAALERLREEWTEAQSRVRQLATEMRNTAAPTQQLRTEFLLAQASARTSKDAFNEQRASLEQLRRGIAATKAVAATFAPIFAEAANEQNRAADSAKYASNSYQGFLMRLLGLDRAAIQTAQSMRQLNQATRAAGAGVGTWGEGTRRALSLTQRLRGEVLSLAAAYLGLFQAINQVGGIVTAFRQAEAATNRFGVVFNQDVALVAQEMQFVTVQADRLGLQFGILADEYSKFAVAAAASGLSIRDTRDAFVSIAEVARVNKLSMEQLSGVYLAFTQILSKGKFTSEEVRRQLGDRLPGAFTILADAIGVTGAELDKMLAKGQLRADADTLLKFTDELKRRFGPQLATSIESTSAELDRFKNTIFQAQLTVGRGGFIEALTDVVRELNRAFATSEAREFFLGIGQFLGNATRALGVFVQNLDKIIRVAQVAFAVIIARGLADTIRGLAQTNALSAQTVISINRATVSFAALGAAIRSAAIGAFNATAIGLRTTLVGVNTQLSFTAVRSGIAAAALGILRVAATATATAMRALWIAIGGFPGLIIAGATILITELFGRMATSVPDATKALEEHERQVAQVMKAYEAATDKGGEFVEHIEEVSLLQAEKTLRDLDGAFSDAFDKANESAEGFNNRLQLLYRSEGQDAYTRATITALSSIVQEFQSGALSAREATEAVNELYSDIRNEKVRAAAQDFAALTFELFQVDERAGRQAVIAKSLGSTWSQVENIIERSGVSMNFLAGEVDNVTGRLSAQERGLQDYRTALEELLELNPDTKDLRSQQKDLADALKAFEDAKAALALAGLGEGSPEFAAAEAAYKSAVAGINRQTDAYKEAEKAAKKLREEEEKRQEKVKEITNDLIFQLDQLDRSDRDQAIADVLKQAVGATPEQQEVLRLLTGAVFDAETAEDQKNMLRDLQEELFGILDIPISREQFILNESIKDGVDLTTEFGKEYRRLQGEIYDANEAIKETKKSQEELRDVISEVREIEALRNSVAREMQQALEDGNGPAAEVLRQQVELLSEELKTARDAALQMAYALGDSKAVAQLLKINTELDKTEERLLTVGQIQQNFASGAAQAFLSIGDAIGGLIDGTNNLGDAFGNVLDSFRQFASNFLSQIAEMILQAMLLRAIQNFGAANSGFGFLSALTRHSGGMVGGSSGRMVPEWLFANAMRYHTGGIAGLKPGEVPAVLREGEEILTESDPRHMMNGGNQSSGNVKIVNAIDAGSFISEGLGSADGERAFLNFVKANRSAVRAAMG